MDNWEKDLLASTLIKILWVLVGLFTVKIILLVILLVDAIGG